LITRGEKTSDSKGSGTGGADIKELVEKYEGTFNLLNQENELFPVTYILSFPILLNMDGNGN
jgi:type I restriction enzyme M protein